MANASKTEIERILIRAREILATARLGSEYLKSKDKSRILAGLRNVIVFGRAVTNVIENLRSRTVDFDEWYRSISDSLKDDPVMKKLYELRSIMLKEGKTNTEVFAEIKQMDRKSFSEIPMPKNASMFFMGDENGGSGWEVILPDGSKDKFYVSIPEEIGRSGFTILDLPKSNNGELKSLEEISKYYLDKMENIINLAEDKFLN